LTTRISKEGQAITDVRYFVKSRGNPNFRVTLPETTGTNELWSASVNGQPVVPVTDGAANLIPLPQHADPDTVLTIDLQYAMRSTDAKTVNLTTPAVAAPVMLAEWKLQPDEGQRLQFRSGTLTPVDSQTDVSGFAQIAHTIHGSNAGAFLFSLIISLAFLFLALVLWRWAVAGGTYRFTPRYLFGSLAGLTALVFAIISFLQISSTVETMQVNSPETLTFLAPVQQAGSALTVQVANLPAAAARPSSIARAWPALIAAFVWILAWMRDDKAAKAVLGIIGWTLLAWTALRLPNGATVFHRCDNSCGCP